MSRLSLFVSAVACVIALSSAKGIHPGVESGRVHIGRASGGLIGSFAQGRGSGILTSRTGRFARKPNFFNGGIFSTGKFGGNIFDESQFGARLNSFGKHGDFENLAFTKLAVNSNGALVGKKLSTSAKVSTPEISPKDLHAAKLQVTGASGQSGSKTKHIKLADPGVVSGIKSSHLHKTNTGKLPTGGAAHGQLSGIGSAKVVEVPVPQPSPKVAVASVGSKASEVHAGLQVAQAGLQSAHANLQGAHAGLQSAHAGLKSVQEGLQGVNVNKIQASLQGANAGLLAANNNLKVAQPHLQPAPVAPHTSVSAVKGQDIHPNLQAAQAADLQNLQAGLHGGAAGAGQTGQFGALGNAHLVTGVGGLPGSATVLSKPNLGQTTKGGRFDIGSLGNSLVDQALKEISGGEVVHSFWKDGQLHTTIVVEEEPGQESQFSEAELAGQVIVSPSGPLPIQDPKLLNEVEHSAVHSPIPEKSSFGQIRPSSQLFSGQSVAVQNPHFTPSHKVSNNVVKTGLSSVKSPVANIASVHSLKKKPHPFGVTFKNPQIDKLKPTIIKGAGVHLSSSFDRRPGLVSHSGHGASGFLRHRGASSPQFAHPGTSGLRATSFVKHGFSGGQTHKQRHPSAFRSFTGVRRHRATAFVQHTPEHPFGEGLDKQ